MILSSPKPRSGPVLNLTETNVFAENGPNAESAELAVVPLDFHAAVGADVPDVPESSRVVGHFLLPDAHAHPASAVQRRHQRARGASDEHGMQRQDSYLVPSFVRHIYIHIHKYYV